MSLNKLQQQKLQPRNCKISFKFKYASAFGYSHPTYLITLTLFTVLPYTEYYYF